MTPDTPADGALASSESVFMDAVWDTLKADANDLRKQQRILRAFRAALIPRPAEPAQAAQVEIERNRAEAYQGGWDDGYAEGFGKAVALVMDGIPKETAYGRGVRSLVSDIIAAAQEGRE